MNIIGGALKISIDILNFFKQKRLTSILLGTETDILARLVLHLLFWICIFKWFIIQSQWIGGNSNPAIYYQIAIQKYVIMMACFYAISYVLGRNLSMILIGLFILVILMVTLVVYGLTNYELYNYLVSNYTAPGFFKLFVNNISKDGKWTFLRNDTAFYFYIEQLGTALFIPLTIKIFRFSYRANFEKLQLEKDKLLLEVNFLRSQINPHFLFNTLNSVYSLIEDKDETAAAMVHSLSDMMRYALYHANGIDTEVSKELHFITNYVDIQKIRHSKRLTVTTTFDTNFKGFKIPPLLLIDFVENAFKHGADQISKDAWITIEAKMTDQDEFYFQVINLKPDLKGETEQIGIGLANASRRLNIFYPNRHQLDIVETAQTYDVVLKIW